MARRTESSHVALLRAVNVGGNNLLPMKGLAELFIGAGCTDVQTYIASGNVIFHADDAVMEGLSERITNEIFKCYKHRPAVILRTAEQLRAVIQANPFSSVAADEKALHVLFLADLADARAAAKLDPDRSRPDVFALRNRELYLHLRNGMGRTKLTTTYFDSILKTTSTARSWRTVLKLYDLMKCA